MLRLPRRAIAGAAVLICAACALVQSPAEQARSTAEAAGFLPVDIQDARVRAFEKRSAPGANTLVTIYIESDGAPWRFADEPPADPTPLRPLVLKMTLADPSPAVAYLARPCQYLPPAQRAQCDPQLWMRARFGDEAIAALNAAVDRIKQDYRAAGVNLVGYSGGGAMAALLAARRSDVNCLVTIAAPLDTRAWTDSLGVSPLDRSLNPADYADRLRKVRQTHFRGMRDKVVAPATIGRYLERVTDAAVIDKAAFGHDCCWAEEWQELRRSSCLVQ